MSACRSCGAPVFWAYTGSGARIPVDQQPTADGNMFCVQEAGGEPTVAIITAGRQPPAGARRYTSHFATCPDAAAHRRPR